LDDMLKNETPVSFVRCLSLVSYDSKMTGKIIIIRHIQYLQVPYLSK